MTIANLEETLLSYTLRKSYLNLEISELQAQKRMAVYAQSEANSLLSARKSEVRDYFKGLYNDCEEYQELYKNYTEIPDFEEQIDLIVAEAQDKLDEIAAWEQAIDEQITTDSTELAEIKAFEESIKNELSANIQEDFNFGLNS